MKKIADQHTVLERNPEQIFSTVDDEVIMLSVENEEYYALNHVGSKIWSLLDTPKEFNKIVDELLAVFDIDRSSCEIETQSFIKEMVELGLIKIHHEKGN